ncbi:3D-(3,5/4)-trihydroxycyclohexane-1,2-dione acylhydrolase (decyclizing) [Bacteriovoracaceae bacterium]|nr:3D-(3,5/4)-trihydroxycyclohexane-1,2-dione acylhydrolase (decyclizing) [Bacteriovoracaceae bacterium]
MNIQTKRLTVAQAIICFLKNQYVTRDGETTPFFAGCFGIFGHGNLAGIGQALKENPDFRYCQSRNEQSMVHAAVAYAKMKNRMQAWACTSSIGPGATNMLTAAAGATINRLPVLLLPGDIFADRNLSPVLQQLEHPSSFDISVNDCFKPISKFWDRINRPSQLPASLMETMRVLTSPSETGTVTLCLPQDVQAEAYHFPIELFSKRIWTIPRARPDHAQLKKAIELIQNSNRPLIIAGGGVIYSNATNELKTFAETTGIPVTETYGGKGALPWNDSQNVGACGVTGTKPAVTLAAKADLIIGIGTRYSDFTTSSKTAFQNPDVCFININISEFDSHKLHSLSLVGDAMSTLIDLQLQIDKYISPSYQKEIKTLQNEWSNEITPYLTCDSDTTQLSQPQIIGVVNSFMQDKDVMVSAAGSLPGDLHKLWRATHPKNFHLEYGYSCMGYEIAGGMGIKMACTEDREVYIMVGDGSYLMMAQEISTAICENIKVIIILINNHGYASIGSLSESLGSERFGTQYRIRDPKSGKLSPEKGPVDFCMNAKSLGAKVETANDLQSFKKALTIAKENQQTTLISIENDLSVKMPGYSWWDVPTSEVSNDQSVNEAYARNLESKKKQRNFL